MNRECRDLLGVTREDAAEILGSVFEYKCYAPYLSYFAFPVTYGNTKGPLSRSANSIAGQAMTTFTIEAWTDLRHTVLFCQGLVIDIRLDKDGFNPMTLRIGS